MIIKAVSCNEILDSRGRPTLSVQLDLDQGSVRAAVPSGASTGSREALELRDHDEARFAGAGVHELARTSSERLSRELTGLTLASVADQRMLDERLAELDGSSLSEVPADGGGRWAELGGNVAVGVSMAATRAIAVATGRPLWRVINDLLREVDSETPEPRLPVPHFNVINGGAHAVNDLEFQEFMLAPLGAPSLSEAVRAGAEVYAKLKAALTAAGYAVGLGDEGGFAPALAEPTAALELIVQAIRAAGYEPGPAGISIALDPAANGFETTPASAGASQYTIDGRSHDVDSMIDYYAELAGRFPIWSLEDGLAEDDWDGWTTLTRRLGDRLQLVGDDIFVTDPVLIGQGIEKQSANAALIKLNQVGTVSQTIDALATCRRAGWAAMISHRSGETTDTFIADLVVGSGCGQIKSGAPARGERVAKYNRLMELDAEGAIADWGLSEHARSRLAE